MTAYQELRDAADSISARIPLAPRVALILGSGLGSLADDVEQPEVLPFREIPHFPTPTAPGHSGRLVVGRLEGQPVAAMAGRGHMYEGYSAQHVAVPVQTMRLLGVEILIVTNAAGGINRNFRAGDLMLISDHLNLTGRNPLVGPNDAQLGTRFPDMTHAYDRDLQALARRVAEEEGIRLVQGVYAGMLGPSYETPAEIRMLRTLGADAVGMSTVMEVIAARHAGLRVLGISCISNPAAGMGAETLDEQDVIETAELVRPRFSRLIRGVLRKLA